MKRTRTIEERKQSFIDEVEACRKESDEREMLNDFFRYWTQINPGGSKMLFEKERTKKAFQTCLRLNTWRGRWSPKKPDYKEKGFDRPYPDYYSKKLAASLTPQQHQEYKQHLQGLGFTFGSGPGGMWIRKPEGGQLIWLT